MLCLAATGQDQEAHGSYDIIEEETGDVQEGPDGESFDVADFFLEGSIYGDEETVRYAGRADLNSGERI